jgi:TPR repeat protein
MFFQRAAESGLPQGALALGGTYDPEELAKLKVIGLRPDHDAARKWYEKARELGSSEAAGRLQRLGTR